jgi:hypothetical protein
MLLPRRLKAFDFAVYIVSTLTQIDLISLSLTGFWVYDIVLP